MLLYFKVLSQALTKRKIGLRADKFVSELNKRHFTSVILKNRCATPIFIYIAIVRV